MFGIDRAIDEFNKEKLYGKKPKVPKKIKNHIAILSYGNTEEEIEQLPTTSELMDKMNEIIEYLEWLDK